MDSSLDYCRKSLKRNDYHHYLISLLMPADTRPVLWTLHTFKHTIESIPDLVSDQALGYMRLTWWRDQIMLLEQGKHAKGQPLLSSLQNYLSPSLPPPLSRGEVGRGVYSHLIDFINEHEAMIENPGQPFLSAVWPELLEKILGDIYPRYRKLEDRLAEILKKHHGTKWEANPPLLALRLWLSRFFI